MALVISIDDVITQIWKTGSLMLAVAASIAVVSLTETYLPTAIFSRMGRDIRNTLFEKSQALTIDQFNRFGPASMITRSTNEMLAVKTDTAINVQKLKRHLAKAKLKFRNVTFQYQGAEEPVLNHILVMRDGTIIEQGSHDELMKLGKFYANLYNSPFSSLPSSANLV